eukprot:CAMPEP_0194385830 /NCGR_PEP_ID=MMETSP0174-20130528/82755_1 /TAXON_ID=216777 /ORGANISM="Proboscia alata, Strain PI-D3" /LENGTH=64 /DNA_ID=CAMNT_0039174365 /DNA_START=695 /DNA_END=886 /DNA_ORIENTATION=-
MTSKPLCIPEYYGYCFLLLADSGKVNKERIVGRNCSLNGVMTTPASTTPRKTRPRTDPFVSLAC